ncbi:MAG TPA: Gfo/Idh/MocA family oxidoreductase [Prolixibacteraceae bacterium]|nr:Gfo/Idh/MocA family oxidoreductase [Prolixibacteraceae bacterium]
MIMSKRYNWAVLGCGRIARKFSSDLKLLSNARLYASAARELKRAEEFAADLGFEKAYGSYEEMVADPAVDVVYVATPHSHHHDHVLLCLNAGKAVLNEKAFALTFAEAREMVLVAREKQIFLMEAFWTRFQPSFQKALEIVRSGDLGALKVIRSDFAFNAPKDPEKRLFNVSLGGGSLLDIGVYPVFAALSALGVPESIRALATFAPTGAEESIAMVFRYPGGELASLFSSLATYSFVTTEYNCERGSVRLARRWMAPTTVTVWREGGDEKTFDFPAEGMGYQYEAAHVMECLDAGKTESDLMPLSFTLAMMETLDRIRRETGILFPGRE